MPVERGPGGQRMRIAVDLLGGDHAPASVIDALDYFVGTPSGSDVDFIVVGPVGIARSSLERRGIGAERVVLVEADGAVPMGADPIAALRGGGKLTAQVCAELVASGSADAWVSAGHSGATVAASAFAFGRLPGMPSPGIAVALPGLHGPVVLADVGASLEATPQGLLAYATAATSYAQSLGVAHPRVGLLSIGSEPGKGDRLRKDTDLLLRRALGASYVGPVEGHDVPEGARADVVVCDGFTGNVLLKGIEGAVRWSAERMGRAYGTSAAADQVVQDTFSAAFAGGLVMGLDGVAVVGHGHGTGEQIAACFQLAVDAVRSSLVVRMREALAGTVDVRSGIAVS